MRLIITGFITFMTLSFLFIGLFNPSSVLTAASEERSLAPVVTSQERSLVPVPDYGGYYAGCSSRSDPYYRDRWRNPYEVCYRWIPGHYKYHRKWVPGYWTYQRVWVPGYWKHDKRWVEGRWETTYDGQPYPDYYRDSRYYPTPRQDYRDTGMPLTAPDIQRDGQALPYGYFDASGVWVPYRQ